MYISEKYSCRKPKLSKLIASEETVSTTGKQLETAEANNRINQNKIEELSTEITKLKTLLETENLTRIETENR